MTKNEVKATKSKAKAIPVEEISEPPFPLFPAQTQCAHEGFASVARLLEGRKNIVVLAGAGLSVSCGIPDFRSEDEGLYSTLDYVGLGLSSPEDLFDLETFQNDPRPFYRFAKSLYPGTVSPSPSHRFLAVLEQQKVLLRVYTQNIDGLEEKAGIPSYKVVPCHGSLSYAYCMKCRCRFDASAIEDQVLSGTVPICTKTNASKPGAKTAAKRKLSNTATPQQNTTKRARPCRKVTLSQETNSLQNDNPAPYINQCGGVIKPGVVFFGEKLQDNVGKSLQADHDKADAIIVIGTSLSVAPMNKVIHYLPPNIPRILINRNVVHLPFQKDNWDKDFRHGYSFDAYLLGNCDDVTTALAKQMGFVQCLSSSHAATNNLNTAQLYPIKATPSKENISISDRTFLFPGAVYDAREQQTDSDATVTEIVHCDNCELQISGTIMKCTTCFDFDLCMACFPLFSKKHFRGDHVFAAESHSDVKCISLGEQKDKSV